jgi:hypothetical protein
MVAAATGDLCEAANEAVRGNIQRERVIASAKAVSASTAQLLSAAASASLNPASQSQIRLKAAGKGVTTATVSKSQRLFVYASTDYTSFSIWVINNNLIHRNHSCEPQKKP